MFSSLELSVALISQCQLAQIRINPGAFVLDNPVTTTSPNLFISLIAGIVMAFAFQLLLTNLGVAILSTPSVPDGDDDNDNVPNFKDDELDSPKDSFVDVKGVQLNDSIIDYQYRFYMDSTGAFAKVVVRDHKGNELYNTLYQKEYTVEIGTFNKGLPPELMTKFLSISDISSTNLDDSTTIYTAGKFNNLLDAEMRKKQLVEEGLKDAKVVYKQNGKFYNAPDYNASNSNTAGNNNNNNGSSGNKDKHFTSLYRGIKSSNL